MKEETKEFLIIANSDLEEAKKALKSGLIRSACYWSQQSIELFLKAFLIEKDVFDPKIHKTHNLLFLARECYKIDKDFEEILKIRKLDFLSRFATGLRYDKSFIEGITEEDARESIEIANKVREFVLKKLNITENI